jgi:multiple sugar transport system substrate-binding protein
MTLARSGPGWMALLLGCLFLLGSCRDIASNERLIHLWIMPNTPEPLRDMEKMVKGFEMENPGIRVQVTVLDWNSAWTKITTAATAQQGPDLVQLPTTWAASITEMGALVSVDSLLDVLGGNSLFAPAAMEYARPRASDSTTSLPWFLDVRPLFYRKDVLARVGFAPESLHTWNDFTRALSLIRDARPKVEGMVVAPLGYPGKNDWNVIHNFAPWIWGAGGDFLDSTATRSAIASPHSVEGIMFYLDLVRNGFNERRNLEKNTAQVSSDFDEGRTAFWFDATTKTIYLDRPQFLGGTVRSPAARNYACMAPPSSPVAGGARYFIGGSNLAVFKSSKHPRESMALLRYLVGRSDVQFQMARTSGFLPALIETYELPYFREDDNRRVFQQMVRQAKAYPSVHYWGEIETSILMRRFANIFDLITAARPGTWPREAIMAEIYETDREITNYIQRQLAKRPDLRNRLLKYRAPHLQGQIRDTSVSGAILPIDLLWMRDSSEGAQ